MAKLSEKAKQHKNQYNNQYKKETYKEYTLRLNKNTNADVIEKIENVENKRNYIIDLIRKDISTVQKKGEVINMSNELFKFICESYSEHYKKYLEYDDKFYEFKASGESLKAKQSAYTREYHRGKMENIEDVMNDYFEAVHLEYKNTYPLTGRTRCIFNVGEFKLLNFIDEDGNIKVEELWNFVQIG